ncbi:hypothetical protein, partial [Porphyromonas loveana]|uniref:hypothetical protein n=1 Tax=Porphyromonas loveana TaxID=1884669 RepID=UPI00359F9615
ITILCQHESSKKLAPFQNYFGAISKRFMRQNKKLLARSPLCFWHHILDAFSAYYREGCSTTLKAA